MNPLEIALGAVNAVPTIVAGVEYLHAEKDSATKQQLALDSLTVLMAGIAKADPNAGALTSELNTLFSSLINVAVVGFNATGVFKHKAKPAIDVAV